MVVLKIKGGLGNQLFQYAFARALAERGYDVFLDVTTFYKWDIHKSGTAYREFLLDKYNTSLPPAEQSNVWVWGGVFSKYKWSAFIYIIYRICIKLFFSALHNGCTHNFDGNFIYSDVLKVITNSKARLKTKKRFFDVPNSYISGYFQSEKYFLDIRSIILNELTLKNTLCLQKQDDILLKDSNLTTVSVHVRRGDYADNGMSLPLLYYNQAFELMELKFTNITYCIFSDDLEWCKSNLDIQNRKYQFMNENRYYKDYEELMIMSKCKHHIIANSSFSWWGAWLGTHPEKMVVAPKKWNANIIPYEWVKI